MMKSLKLCLLLGVALGAGATNTMARERTEGPRGGELRAIADQQSGLLARERSEGPRGRDPRIVIDRQSDQLAREGRERPRGEDDEDDDIGDDKA